MLDKRPCICDYCFDEIATIDTEAACLWIFFCDMQVRHKYCMLFSHRFTMDFAKTIVLLESMGYLNSTEYGKDRIAFRAIGYDPDTQSFCLHKQIHCVFK